MASLFRSLLDTLSGKKKAEAAAAPKPVYTSTPTSGSRYASPAAPGLHLREVRVTEVRHETADAVTLRFEPTTGAPFVYQAGQFLTFDLVIDGEELRRAYSLSSSPLDPGAASVTVKRIPGGRVSTYMTESVGVGTVLRVLGPSGEFTCEPRQTGEPRHLVLIAGGSGITPIYSLATTLLRAEPSITITLLYGNRAAPDVIFAEALARLATDEPRLRLLHVLEQAPNPEARPSIAPAAIGRLDGATVKQLLDAQGGEALLRSAEVYLCGPEPMMDSVTATLEASGVATDRLHHERFTSPGRRSGEHGMQSQPIRFRKSGRVVMPRAGETVLDAGLRAGEPMNYSCAMGGCGACKIKLESGTVQMEEPNCLTPRERAAGYVLACVGRATTPIEVAG